MNLTLWITAGLLAVIFLAGGAGKLIMSKEGIAAEIGITSRVTALEGP